jgi:ATP-dependent Clp protease ATP-binding subunit ClpX
MFSVDGVDLEVQTSALRLIAQQAKARNTGARGLRGIIENLLLKSQFDLPQLSKDGVSKIIITDDMVNNGSEPMRVHRAVPAAANV